MLATKATVSSCCPAATIAARRARRPAQVPTPAPTSASSTTVDTINAVQRGARLVPRWKMPCALPVAPPLPEQEEAGAVSSSVTAATAAELSFALPLGQCSAPPIDLGHAPPMLVALIAAMPSPNTPCRHSAVIESGPRPPALLAPRGTSSAGGTPAASSTGRAL
jgi:hypothetical protein